MALLSACRFTTPDSPAELRDEGLCLYALERYSEAAESLEQYLQQSTWGPDHKQVWFVMPFDSQRHCQALLIFEARQSHVRTWCPWPCSCARCWRGCADAKTLMHQRTRHRGRQDCSMHWSASPPLLGLQSTCVCSTGCKIRLPPCPGECAKIVLFSVDYSALQNSPGACHMQLCMSFTSCLNTQHTALTERHPSCSLLLHATATRHSCRRMPV